MPIPWLASAMTTTTKLPVYTTDQVLSPYIYIFYAAFIVSMIFTPIMRGVATFYGIIDQPDGIRKMHSQPVAYLGGVAVFLGWMAGLAFSQFVGTHSPDGAPHTPINFSIVIGAAVIVILGLWDDIRNVGPWIKIAGQIFGALFLLSRGIGTNCTQSFLQPLHDLMMDSLGHSFITGPVILVSSCSDDHRYCGGLLQRHQSDGRPGRFVRRGDRHHCRRALFCRSQLG